MKLILGLFMSTALLAATDPATKPAQDTKAPAAKAKTTPPPTEIPANAEEVEPGTFRYTDSLGKKWFLRKTPFGLARFEDTGAGLSKKAAADDMSGVKITEDGDLLHFQREGPFGIYKWDKKKSELSDTEKTAWERQKAAEPSKTSAKQE